MPINNFLKCSRDCGQGLPKIFRASIYRAHRTVIFAIAQLSCSLWILCTVRTYCDSIQWDFSVYLQMQNECAWAIGNLAGGSTVCRDTLQTKGAVQPLIALLKVIFKLLLLVLCCLCSEQISWLPAIFTACCLLLQTISFSRYINDLLTLVLFAHAFPVLLKSPE